MHTHFGDWYREVSLEVESGTLSSRWTGLENHSGALDLETAADVVRLAHRKPLNDERLDSFRQPFLESDTAFPMRNNDEELSVLACGTLIVRLENGPDPISTLAALLVDGMRLVRIRPAVDDLSATSASYLARQAVGMREVTNQGFPASADPGEAKKAFRDLAAKAETSNPPQMHEEFKEAANKLGAVLTGLRTGMDRAFTYADELGQIEREQSDILWWLFGQASRTISGDLTNLSDGAKAIVIGKELGRLIRISPPPAGFVAFIDRALLEAKTKPNGTTSIKEAVESLVDFDEGASKVLIQDPGSLSDLLPAHTAISLASDIGEGWSNGLERKTGVDPASSLTHSILGQLTLTEATVLRLHSGSL